MRKRPQNQRSTLRKRSRPTRPATEQTPELPAHACSTPTRPSTEQTPEIPAHACSTPTLPATEQTPEIPANDLLNHIAVIPGSDAADEPYATTEHIGMACLFTIDDVTLISIFHHFANCYVAMPMVGTCRRIFITWTRKRRQLALEELTNLRCWLEERELENVMLFNQQNGGHVAIRSIYLPLCELTDLIR